MRKILILDSFKERHIKLIKSSINEDFELVNLSDVTDEDKISQALLDAEIVLGVPSLNLIKDYETSCPNLKFIQMTWAGTDIYTRNAGFPWGQIKLANASGAYGHIISQFVIAQILSLMLNFKTYHQQQIDKVWMRRGPVKTLEGSNVLVFGSGDIGSCVARRLVGFDAKVTGVCRDTSKARPGFDRLCTLDEAEKYLPETDVVVCCMPNTSKTEGYLNADRLKLIKNGAVIVNVGRGNFIDCMALNDELSNGHLYGAALDVTNPEPLPFDHPLWTNPRAIITPHASGVSFNNSEVTEDKICNIVCNNLKLYIDGKEITNRVYSES